MLIVYVKPAFFCNHIVENQFDCVGITETWLSSEDGNNTSTLCKLIPSTYKMSHVPRQGTTGGGVAFLHRDHYNVRIDTSYTASSFESMTAMLEAASYTFRLFTVFHLQMSTNSKNLYLWSNLQTTLSLLLLCQES